jgi:hypothetical protein
MVMTNPALLALQETFQSYFSEWGYTLQFYTMAGRRRRKLGDVEPYGHDLVVTLEHEGKEIGNCNGTHSTMPSQEFAHTRTAEKKHDVSPEVPCFKVIALDILPEYRGKNLGILLLFATMTTIALRDGKHRLSYFVLEDMTKMADILINVYSKSGFLPYKKLLLLPHHDGKHIQTIEPERYRKVHNLYTLGMHDLLKKTITEWEKTGKRKRCLRKRK